MPLRLAVLASLTGSLFEAMIKQQLPVQLMVADRQCRALEIADKAGIPYEFLPRTFGRTFDREEYTRAMMMLFRAYGIDLVAMAGFMTVFAPAMFAPDAYQLRILNTHPSLLPSFKGDHAVRDALAYGVKISGCTIHWATEKLDDGPILAQEAVRVSSGDTIESLHERIKTAARELYRALLRGLVA